MPLILLIDDDLPLVENVQAELGRLGYSTCFATDGAGALHQVIAEQPDLVMLDLRLPDVDGLILLGKIRETNPVPVIVVSGRHEQSDRVMALQRGADDFLMKPFDIDELEARIMAVLRRSEPAPEPGLRLGGFTFSTAFGARLGSKPLHLSPMESRIVHALMTHMPDPLSTSDLIGILWGNGENLSEEILRVHMYRIRKRFSFRPGSPRVENVRGVGYRILAADDD